MERKLDGVVGDARKRVEGVVPTPTYQPIEAPKLPNSIMLARTLDQRKQIRQQKG